LDSSQAGACVIKITSAESVEDELIIQGAGHRRQVAVLSPRRTGDEPCSVIVINPTLFLLGEQMKMRIAYDARKGLAACFLLCGLMIPAPAQTTTLAFKNGKATVRKIIRPRKESDADLYALRLRKGQTVAIKVAAGSFFLSKDNECSVFFELFDGAGEAVWIGDSMTGIDDWDGAVEKTGNYKIKVAMQCLEGFVTSELRKKKPALNYTLQVQMK
jgi:hypothetical protein